MRTYEVGVAFLFLGVALQGCATANQKLDLKLSEETSIQTKADLRAETSAVIGKAQGLTPAQRTQLETLRSSVGVQLDQVAQHSLKLRAILVRDLVAPVYELDEVDLIKGRLSALEEQRLKLIFEAISKANDIMGRNAAGNEPVFRDFFEPHSNRD